MQGMVFDYYVDDATCSMVPWENKVPSFSYMPDSFASLFVPTVDTTRLTYFLDTLIAKKHFVMFVGNTGTCCFTHLMATFQYLCEVIRCVGQLFVRSNILDSCQCLLSDLSLCAHAACNFSYPAIAPLLVCADHSMALPLC